MEQIKIVFFLLGSFFGMEDGLIAANETVVTVYPKEHKIEIIQNNLFAIVQLEKDTILVSEQWNKITKWNEQKTGWSNDLEDFSEKNISFRIIDNDSIQPHLSLTYSNEKDLSKLGIWYDAEKNQFSINHIPNDNITSNDGQLVGNYYIFDGNKPFTFTIEPFLQMLDVYKSYKRPLNEVIHSNN